MGWFSRKATDDKQKESTAPNVAGLTAESLIGQAMASVAAGETKSALSALDQAIALDPTNPEAYMRRGELRRKPKDERGAGQDMSMAKLMIDRMDEGLKANDDGKTAYTSGDTTMPCITSTMPSRYFPPLRASTTGAAYANSTWTTLPERSKISASA